MYHFPFRQIMDVSGTAIPLAILLIEDDAQRAFLTEMYFQDKALMYKTAATLPGSRRIAASKGRSGCFNIPCPEEE